jgi:hypothetical protein
MPQPIVKAQVGNMTFGVTEQQARDFGQRWDSGGIKIILDNTTISFANAWANIALKSALENPQVQMAIFKHVYDKIKAGKPGPPQAETAAPEQAKPAEKSSIIITG